MKNDHLPVKKNVKLLKQLRQKLNRVRLAGQSKFDKLNRFKLFRSFKAGHIRGGHAFH